MNFPLKKLVAWLIDYVLLAGLVSIFYFCTRFYEQINQQNNAYLMLLCAVISIFLLTIYVPYHYQATLGESLMHMSVLKKGQALKLKDIIVRDLVIHFVFGEFLLLFSFIYCVAMSFMKADQSELPIDRFMHVKMAEKEKAYN